jgi:hypothetical protein
VNYKRLGYTLHKEAFAVYTGDDVGAKKKEQIENYLTHLEGVSGASLSALPVLVNKSQPWKNFMRYYTPRTMKQIPGKAFKALATVAEAPFSPLLLGSGIPPWYHLQQAFANARTEPGEYYQNDVNTVNITNPNAREALGHEVGHWLDNEMGIRTVPYGKKHSYYNKQTISELNAALMAIRAAKTDKERNKFTRSAGKAFSTYLVDTPINEEIQGEYDKVTGYDEETGKKTKKLPKGWSQKLVKGLKNPDFKKRSKVALLALARLHDTVDITKYLTSTNKDWTRTLLKRYVSLAERILKAEYEAFVNKQ